MLHSTLLLWGYNITHQPSNRINECNIARCITRCARSILHFCRLGTILRKCDILNMTLEHISFRLSIKTRLSKIKGRPIVVLGKNSTWWLVILIGYDQESFTRAYVYFFFTKNPLLYRSK